MKPRESDKQKKRLLVTFEAEPDVFSLIEKAKANGLTQVEIMNKAIREYGQKVISEIVSGHRSKLDSLTFDQPDLQLGGYSIAA